MRKRLVRARRPAALWVLVLLALALRLVVASLTTGADYDIASYAIQAQSVLTHHNIYVFTDRYPYPPVWVWLVALAQWIANATWLPFVWLARLPGILGDALIVALLHRAKGNKAALFYAVNPVAILITAGHGQFDGLVMALVAAAWASRQRQGSAWAALALGGAIALKGYPVLLLPALLAGAPGWKRRALLTGLALTPLLISALVYSAFFGLEPAMASHVLGYVSPIAFGWRLIFNTLLLPLRMMNVSVSLSALPSLARLLILAWPLLLLWRRQRWPLEQHWQAVFLGFYALSPGISVQYLLWVIPLLALGDLRDGWRYTTLSAAGIVCYYLGNFPGAVPWGPALAGVTPPSIWLLGYWAANLAWWLFCLRLLRAMFWRDAKASDLGDRDKVDAASEVLPASHPSPAGFKAKAPDRYESSDNSRPEPASRPETAEKQAES